MRYIHIIFSLFLSLTFLTSCQSESLQLNVNTETNNDTYISQNINIDEAISIADDIALLIDSPKKRSTARSANLNSIEFILSQNSRSSANDTILYLIDYNNNEGFAIISAKKCSNPVIAVIDDGCYNDVRNQNNPGFNMFMNCASLYVQNDIELSKSSTIEPIDKLPRTEEKCIIDTIFHSFIKPKLGNRQWGQDGVEGNSCPNKIAGCTPVAIALIMSYFKQPSHISYTYSDSKTEILDWETIIKHNPFSLSIQKCFVCDESTHNTISQLIREIGERANATYNDSSTSVNQNDAKQALHNLLPDKTIAGYNKYDKDQIRYGISQGIVYLTGQEGSYSYQKFTPYNTWHAWVADGYELINRRYLYYQRQYGETTWNLVNTDERIDDLIHFNWGWNGAGNGYYSNSVFTVSYYYNNEKITEHYSNAYFISIY